jgi:nucleoside-diphosphate-sugar epimerase
MKILITGGGGFLGTEIIRQLKNLGHEVVAFGRSRYPHLEKMQVACIQGDIRKRQDVMNAIDKSFDAIIHSAAIVSPWGKWNDFYETNVQGCQWIVDACRQNGIKILIHTSSPSAVFGVSDLEGVDEEQPYLQHYISHYARSKGMAEAVILGANILGQLHTVCMRPHLIMGPGDPNLLPRILQKARSGRLLILGNGHNKVDVVHVENAAYAHICALNSLIKTPELVCGKAYFIGQESARELWPFINEILSWVHLPAIRRKIPAKLAYVAAGMIEQVYKGLGIYRHEPPMTRFMAKQLSCSHYFNHQRAERLLGYKVLKNIPQLKQDLRQSLA